MAILAFGYFLESPRAAYNPAMPPPIMARQEFPELAATEATGRQAVREQPAPPETVEQRLVHRTYQPCFWAVAALAPAGLGEQRVRGGD